MNIPPLRGFWGRFSVLFEFRGRGGLLYSAAMVNFAYGIALRTLSRFARRMPVFGKYGLKLSLFALNRAGLSKL